ncbi:acyltransferase [Sphingorhabdus lutea]|uniref:Acyltransferase n=1 Tax=Sphingorhabdus lutea TaxID=1913578 RepID=A0A1L3JES0_9SPHN|nr:lysophospholipid acyltransferase family protein [Sphingorhabdus lutea]APG63614.1 acyltransferase [Sphingorhabdus lutea]
MKKEKKVGALSKWLRKKIVSMYRRHGWTARLDVELPPKFVLVAAPHTSNWDFPYFLGLTEDLGIMPHFMAKDSLFRWPMGNFMLDMGGVPVNRASKQNYVEQMIDEFAKRDVFRLTIAPEGTRSSVKGWKTGFYHIAFGAKVPILLGMMDYSTKIGGIIGAVMPSGDYKADMKIIAKYYENIVARHPDKATKNIAEAE